MLLSHAFLFVVCLASELVHGEKRIGTQVCDGLDEGKGCGPVGVRLCCQENLVDMILCNATAQVEYFHCIGHRICAADGNFSVGCFKPGTQPTPPS
jgi:hypothetical protein